MRAAAEDDDFVNRLRVRRDAGYRGTAVVSRRLLKWCGERE
jgi:hypothetical protein